MTIRLSPFMLALLVAMLLAWQAFADQTTYTAQINGVANCQSIVLNLAQQVTPGGTTTTLFYVLKECAPGETTPTVVVGQGNAAIPAGAWTMPNRQSASLRVQTPAGAQGRQGTIDVTWRATTEHQTTFSGEWTEQNGSTTTRTREAQFHTTAQVSGTVVGWTAQGRPGWFGSIVQVGK